MSRTLLSLYNINKWIYMTQSITWPEVLPSIWSQLKCGSLDIYINSKKMGFHFPPINNPFSHLQIINFSSFFDQRTFISLNYYQKQWIDFSIKYIFLHFWVRQVGATDYSQWGAGLGSINNCKARKSCHPILNAKIMKINKFMYTYLRLPFVAFSFYGGKNITTVVNWIIRLWVTQEPNNFQL